MPLEIFEELAATAPDQGRGPFQVFIHDGRRGYTLRAKHVSDNQKKITNQGGVSVHTNLHSRACYEESFLHVRNTFRLTNCTINRLDFALDLQKNLPDHSKVYVKRQRRPMIVPRESITYGWGTKYKSLAAIFYDKLKDISEHKGEKDYLLKHYEGRDRRSGVTRFELRVMKESIKQSGQIYPLESLTTKSPDLRDLVTGTFNRIVIKDPRYATLPEVFTDYAGRYFSGNYRIAEKREPTNYDISQLQKQMFGTALAICRQHRGYREIAANLNDPEHLAELLNGVFLEALYLPGAENKLLSFLDEVKAIEKQLKTKVA